MDSGKFGWGKNGSRKTWLGKKWVRENLAGEKMGPGKFGLGKIWLGKTWVRENLAGKIWSGKICSGKIWGVISKS